MKGIRDYKFFLAFSAYFIPFWLKRMPERGFSIFFNFFAIFFRNFLSQVEYERNSGLNVFSLFRPISSCFGYKKGWKEVFWFFFFLFFSQFSSPGRVWTEFGTKFFLFLSLSHPVWAKNNAGKRFLIFQIFLLFFSEFSCPGRVWTEFRTKSFFCLFRPISSPFWLKIMPERGFSIFWFFFYFFRNFHARVE